MSKNETYDIIVLGGGIVGAATAQTLANRGYRLLLLDQFEPGHDQGSSHGDGRIIRLAYPEPFYLEMAQLAYPAWQALAEQAGQPLLKKSGGWDCGPVGCKQLNDLAQNYEDYNIPYQRLTAAESNRRFPYFHLPPGSEAIYQPDYGVVFATPAVKALWRLAQAAGVEAVAGQRIEQITLLGDRLRLESATGRRWTTERLVIAAGGWAGKLLGRLNLELPLTVTQEQLTYFPAKDDLSHKVGQMPIMIDFHQEIPFYALPQVDVPGVKVGWHHSGPIIDSDHRQPADEEKLAVVAEFVARRFPHLAADKGFGVVRCLYTSTPDHHFILDRHPQLPQVIIGAGFSGHGFKFGPVLGQILAALALDETPPVPLDHFSVGRLENPNQLTPRSGA